MKYSNENLINYTSFFELEAFELGNEQVLKGIEQGLSAFKNITNFDCFKNLEIFYIGSIANDTNINPRDSIDIMLRINNPFLLDANNKYLSTKSRKKRISLISTSNIQLYIANVLNQIFTAVTSIENYGSFILINSLSELGKNYKIFVSAAKGENENVCYGINTKLNAIYQFSPKIASDNFNIKETATQGYFSCINSIVKNICYDANLNINPLVVESLIYNVPNKFFEGTYNEQLMKILNYLKMTNIKELDCIDNTKLYQNLMYDTSIMDIKKIIDSIYENLLD